MTIHAVGAVGGTVGAGDASEFTLQAILAELTQKTEPANQQHVIVDSMPAGGAGLTDAELRAADVKITLDGESVPVTGTFWQVTQPVSGTIAFSNATIAVTNAGIFAVQAAQSGTWNIGTVTTLPAITFASPQHVIIDSGSITANAGTNLNTSTLALEAGGNLAAIKARTDNIPPLGQALAAAAVPVVLTAIQQAALTPPAAITGFATSAIQTTQQTSLTSIDGKLPATLGQKTGVASLPVVLASDALPPPDRVATASITAVSQFGLITSNGSGTTSIAIAGTWAGVFVFFGIDGSGNIQIIKAIDAATGLLSTTTTVNGVWLLPSAGYSTIGLVSNSWTSGTASVGLIAGIGSNAISLAQPLPTGTNNIGAVTVAALTALSKAEDSLAVDADPGIPVLAVRQDLPLVDTSTNGDYSWTKVDSKGRLWVNSDNLDATLIDLTTVVKALVLEARITNALLQTGLAVKDDPDTYRQDPTFIYN